MRLQGWDKLYKEIAEKITKNLDEVQWVDLWHNQVGFLVEEHPFPTPAVFLSFRILNTEDKGQHVQTVTLQIDMYYFYETFLDTFEGAYNQEDALGYLKTINDLHRLFHASDGENFAEMKRTGFGDVDTGSAGNLYKQTFTCNVVDATALEVLEETEVDFVDMGKGTRPEVDKREDYIIPD